MARLLTRGLIAGMIAGFLAALFATFVGEPAMEAALRLEQGGGTEAAGAGSVRPGLFVAGMLCGAGYGGLFALVFACCLGRIGPRDARRLALVLAVAAFVVVYLVPALKYPPSPPGYEPGGTIAVRTAGYFQMVAVSLLSALLGIVVAERTGGARLWLSGFATYVLVVGVMQAVLPAAADATGHYPADLLWQFRLSSAGMQFVLWATLGATFGHFAAKTSSGKRPA